MSLKPLNSFNKTTVVFNITKNGRELAKERRIKITRGDGETSVLVSEFTYQVLTLYVVQQTSFETVTGWLNYQIEENSEVFDLEQYGTNKSEAVRQIINQALYPGDLVAQVLK